MASQVRHCLFPRDRLERPCPNPVLPSLKSFRRHLVTHHDCRLALGSRYGIPDQYVMLTPAEAERMRAVQSSRRCGAALERQYVAEAYGESRRRPSARRYQPPSSSSGPAALSSVPPPVPQYVPPLTKSSVPQPLIHQRPSTPTDERPYLELLGPFSPVSPPSTVPYLPAGYPASDMSAFSLSSGGLNNDTELSEFGDAQLAGRQHAGPRGGAHHNFGSAIAYSGRAAGKPPYQPAALHLSWHTDGRRPSCCGRAGDDRRCGKRFTDGGHRH